MPNKEPANNLLIVIPFCAKDEFLAVKNLEWCLELDGPVQFDCLLAHESGVDAAKVRAVASSYFKTVHEFTYTTRMHGWPMVCNDAFQKTARHIESTFKQSWLWWEPDATPLVSGWLDKLQGEYRSAGQPFMGRIVPGMGHMNGVGIYPWNVSSHTIRGMLAQKHPWDVAMRSETIRNTHPTGLIRSMNWNEYKNGAAVQKNRPAAVEVKLMVAGMIDEGAVLFHYCKDGTLIDSLRGGPSTANVESGLDLTVVITNFQRPEFLWSAFQSCEQAGIRNLVVSSSGATDAVKAVHAKIKGANPNATIISEDGDSGCNVNWLRGVQAVRTSHVHILHDDDLLMPEFGSLRNQLSSQYGFIAWDGAKHGGGASGVHQSFDLPNGFHDAKLIMPHILGERLSVSPVVGCFKTEQVIDTLTECETFGLEFVLRRGHLVGNDLMLWLRAAQRNERFLYLKQPLISYGHHDDSATCIDVFNRENKLMPIYRRTRNYFLATLPAILHLADRHEGRNSDEQRRVKLSVESWGRIKAIGLMDELYQAHSARNSVVVGDARRLPYLKDVIKEGMGGFGGIVMLTNDDTLLHSAVPWILHEKLATMGAVCSFRNSFMPGQSPDWRKSPYELAEHGLADDPGRDLFAFNRDWLKAHFDEIPDYLLGASDWDSTLALIIRRSQGGAATAENWILADPASEIPRGYVHHEYHEAAWRGPMAKSPAQNHNHRLTIQWAEANGLAWRAEQVRRNGC